MSQIRTLLKPDDILVLGNNQYIIKSVMGAGSGSIAYKAQYKDELNNDMNHTVLIKELFPYHPKGGIYRNENGSIECADAAREYFEFHKERFKLGNKANLALLEDFPENVAGNLNSYECRGTYYSVLTFHGGENLDSILERGEADTLRKAANIILAALRSLECFHERGMLHLDVSPDNILMIGDRALLIDYNSVWDTGDNNERCFSFSEKKGYTSPEIILRQKGEVGRCSDLFSLCAVFYRMITGELLDTSRISERAIREKVSEKLPMLCNEYRSAIFKTLQILVRGLHLLPKKRYSDAISLRADIDELIERIDNCGVSKGALFDVSRAARAKNAPEDLRYLRQDITMGDDIVSGTEMRERLFAGTNLLLTGVGGIGKTRFMHELWKSATAKYSEKAPVVLCIPLKMYREGSDEKQFIRKYIVDKLNFSKQHSNIEEMIHELNRLMRKKDGDNVNIILLLDGFNEAGTQTEGLLTEIEGLSKMESVSILLTDRTTAVKDYGLERFTAITLQPLERDVVVSAIEEGEAEVPSDEKMMSLLSNPMMLGLYIKAYSMRREASEENVSINSADELIEFYIDSLVTHQQRIYTGDEKQQIRHKFVLRQLLPEIALEIKKHSAALTLKELMAIVTRNYNALQKRSFGKTFPDYLGKSRLILDGIKSDSEWFDLAIREILCEEVGLLSRTDGSIFSLIHDNFTDTLAEQAKPTELFYKRERTASVVRKIFTTTLLIIFAAALVFTAVKLVVPKEKERVSYTGDQMKYINKIPDEMVSRLGVLNVFSDDHRNVIKYTTDNVINLKSVGETRTLDDYIRRTLKTMHSKNTLYDEELISKLEKSVPEFPTDVLLELCEAPAEMKRITGAMLPRYAEIMSDPNTLYDGSTDRRNVLNYYSKYIDDYYHYIYCATRYVLWYIPDELQAETKDKFKNISMFGQDSLDVMTENPDELKAELDRARLNVKDDDLRGYGIKPDMCSHTALIDEFIDISRYHAECEVVCLEVLDEVGAFIDGVSETLISGDDMDTGDSKEELLSDLNDAIRSVDECINRIESYAYSEKLTLPLMATGNLMQIDARTEECYNDMLRISEPFYAMRERLEFICNVIDNPNSDLETYRVLTWYTDLSRDSFEAATMIGYHSFISKYFEGCDKDCVNEIEKRLDEFSHYAPTTRYVEGMRETELLWNTNRLRRFEDRLYNAEIFFITERREKRAQAFAEIRQ